MGLQTYAAPKGAVAPGKFLDQIIDGREAKPMPGNWTLRSIGTGKGWREKATSLPEDDPEWAVCLEIAEGYERLAALLENRKN
jgi:hypothetical protein